MKDIHLKEENGYHVEGKNMEHRFFYVLKNNKCLYVDILVLLQSHTSYKTDNINHKFYNLQHA